MLIVVAVLAVGGLALWLAYREHAGEAELAELLVESVTSEGARLSRGLFSSSDTPGARVLLPGDALQVRTNLHRGFFQLQPHTLVALVTPVPEPSYRLVQEIQPGHIAMSHFSLRGSNPFAHEA